MTQLGKIVAIQTYIYDDPQGKEQECKIQKPFDAWFHITFSDRVWLKSVFSIAYFQDTGKHWTKTGKEFAAGQAQSVENTGFPK